MQKNINAYKALWEKTLFILAIVLFCKGIAARKCRLDSIKSGYALKGGLNQENIKVLGQANTLESCSRLCCRSDAINFGLYDGAICYGIKCKDNMDKRCILKRDGNAKYTIFKLKKRKKKRRRKQKLKRGKIVTFKNKTKRFEKHNASKYLKKQVKDISIENKSLVNIKAEVKNRSFKLPVTYFKKDNNLNKSKNNQTLHRKHKKRRRKINKKNVNKTLKSRFSRDYPYTYKNLQSDLTDPQLYKQLPQQLNIDRILSDPALFKHQTQRYEVTPSQRSVITNDLPMQSVLDLGTYNNNIETSRSNIYPLADVIPQSINANLHNIMQQNSLTNEPNSAAAAMGSNKYESLIDPALVSSLYRQIDPAANSVYNSDNNIYSALLPLLEKKSAITQPTLQSGYSPTRQNTQDERLDQLSDFANQSDVIQQELQSQLKQEQQILRAYPLGSSNEILGFTNTTQGDNILDFDPTQKLNDNIEVEKAFPVNSVPNIGNITDIKSFITTSKIPIDSRAEIKPLRDFPTDKDLRILDSKDEIPRPDEFEEEHIAAIKDSTIDVPFSSNNQLAASSFDRYPAGCLNPIGVSKSNVIFDDQMTSSSAMEMFPPERGRFRIKENGEDYASSWCASKIETLSGKPQFLQIDTGERQMFCRVATQGDDKLKQWVEKFKIQFSDNGKDWEIYRENGREKIFYGNDNEADTTYRTLKNPILSRYVKFVPVSWFGKSPCMRVELFNTALPQGGVKPSSRSGIPKHYEGIIGDLDFEKMDDAIVLDRSSFGNNGFLYGGAKVYDSHSSCRHAIKIPPGADIVIDGSIMKVQPREAISIAVWVKLNRVEGVHSIFDTVGEHSKHNIGQFHFEIVGGDVRWFHRNETEDIIFSVITGKKLINPNEWNHITATYSSNTGDAIIYVNGTERIRGKGKGLISKDWNQRVGIGRHKGVRFLDGDIDEFKIFDIVIDQSKIDDLVTKCNFRKYYCGSTLTDPTGTIVSPTYPDTLQGPVQCVWNIEGKVGEVISLDMKQFLLGYKGSCGKANLEVRDTENDAVIGTYCGALTPRRIRSHSNRMYIKYFTDGAFKGERFKIDYTREPKRTAKKTLINQCKKSKTYKNSTLVGGAKAGNFTDLGSVIDMDDCKERCCNNDHCNVAFMIDDNCYSVQCNSHDSCRVRNAKSSSLNPQLAYISKGNDNLVPSDVVFPSNTENTESNEVKAEPLATCQHDSPLTNVTLVGGIKSGNFTSHGTVDNFNECLNHCCDDGNCDVAFMVKKTCFALTCASKELCETREARPSPYNPTVGFVRRFKPTSKVVSEVQLGTTKTAVTPTNNNMPGCHDNRLSKTFHDVTLKSGISSGDFTDKGKVSNMDECISKCCGTDSCNVAFVIKDTCFVVKCKSYEDCALKPAVSEYYNPKIVYVNWSPPKDLGEGVPYNYKGCWRDFDISAFALPLMEGTDPKLSEPYKKRADPVSDCSSVSQSRNFKVFAIQNGGACFSGPDAEQTYKRYGKSDACKGGKGGAFANSVYKSFDDGSVIALGCWADLQDRAFRRMEKNNPLLADNIESRADPIGTCSKVAEQLKMPYFALQKGGQCFVAKEYKANYDRYSPSRKCKYGLGGQMANDVYMVKQNFSMETGDNRDISNSSSVSNPPDSFKLADIEDGESVYKEEMSGSEYIRYVYKSGPVMSNVTLSSAINSGTFEDKGKMEEMEDCIKACGESSDCNVAFMLSSQCFNVHCFSDDTCKTKPAFSSFYKPELAYIKHRVIRKPRNSTQNTATNKSKCTASYQLQNMTLINGIDSGNFSDMGHVDSMDECKERCCQDDKCNIAFKIQGDCYGVECFNKGSCKTRPAKNTALFHPELALLRPVKDDLDESMQQKSDAAKMSPTVSMSSTPATHLESTAPTAHIEPIETTNSSTTAHVGSTTTAVSLFSSGNNILSSNPNKVVSSTGDSRTPTQTINSCSADVWDHKTISNETLIGGINAGDFRDHGQADSMDECMGYCCNEKDCDLSFMIDKDCYTVKCYKPSLCKTRIAKPTTFVPQIAFKKSSKIAIDKSNLTELLQNRNKPTPENNTAELAYAAFRSVLFGLPDSFNSSQENNSSEKTNMDDLHAYIQSLFNETTPVAYTQPAQPPTLSGSQATPTFGNPQKHSCQAEPIVYNATLRLGMHSGLFTKLGRVHTMDDCIERCCRSSNADVAYMLGPFCFAVKCKTREMCKPSPAMYSDITSLNLSPAISFLNKEALINAAQGTHKSTLNDEGTCSDSPITYNVTLRGGVHSGKFTELGEGIPMRDCVRKCCDTPLCDVAFMFSDKCYAVGCYDEAQCQAVSAKPSGLNPKLAYVSKYRNTNAVYLDSIPSGIGFDSKSDTCNAKNVRHGTIYANKTLLGGMKAGKFSYLGNAKDIQSCLSKCCSAEKCDMAYLVNKEQCFAVKCFSPELCQVTGGVAPNNKQTEISSLVRPLKKRKLTRGTMFAYLAIGLVVIVTGLTGLIWGVLVFVKRNHLRNKENEENIPKPER